MADEKNTDISTPFIFQTSPPYAAPGDHYQYDLYWLVNQLKQALTNTETLRLHDIGQDTRLDGLDVLTAQLKDATDQLLQTESWRLYQRHLCGVGQHQYDRNHLSDGAVCVLWP